ncbi:Hypothetical predicted protein [Paramuricea clavata]|uniref:Uncharacterized protein n=1 Tax=Paramuricea clavata TaxID=317549 RepID=A0A7D9M4N0_PARCT|nr:Hypothetical predicted protein [Paramuricea clavata]
MAQNEGSNLGSNEEIRANKGDGKRSLCFTPSPNSKRPPDKRAKNLNYDEDIRQSLASNFAYEEGCVTGVDDILDIVQSDLGRPIRRVDLYKAISALFGEKTEKKYRKTAGSQCDGKDNRKKMYPFL